MPPRAMKLPSISLGSGRNARKNLPILRNLLADVDNSVHIAAAVTLLNLGQQEVKPSLLNWLREKQTQWLVLNELLRLSDHTQLALLPQRYRCHF